MEDQLRAFLYRKVGINAWTVANVWVHRPAWRPGHESHSSAYVENVSQAEAHRCLNYVGGCWDAAVCTTKRLHVEVAHPRCLGLQYYCQKVLLKKPLLTTVMAETPTTTLPCKLVVYYDVKTTCAHPCMPAFVQTGVFQKREFYPVATSPLITNHH